VIIVFVKSGPSTMTDISTGGNSKFAGAIHEIDLTISYLKILSDDL